MNLSDGNRGLSDLTDEALVQIARSSIESEKGRGAGTELLGRYTRAVYLWCYRYMRDHEQALDLSQEVLMSAWKARGSFSGRSKFSTWLFAITRNRCLNEMQRVSLLEGDDTAYGSAPSPEPDPERRLEEYEGEERIYAIIRETLEPEEQKAIWLRCFERMPVDAITSILGIDSASGARGLLQRARRKLRSALKETGDE
jgi:RNA polymerase sigma-70 factor (ECF subfamily)